MKRAVAAIAVLIIALLIYFNLPSIVYPWIDQPPALARAAPVPQIGLSAKQCGQCHREIYAEWSTSLMAEAATNSFFLAEREEQAADFLCGRCHHPMFEQEREVISGLKSLVPLTPIAKVNDAFDPTLHAEGVTCVVCHLSSDSVLAPSGAPTIYNARVLSDATPPHPLAVGPALAEDGRVCVRCHQFDPPGGSVRRPPLDTFAEFERYRAQGGEETCFGCHMPKRMRAAVPGSPVREGHEHRFLGIRDGAFIARYVKVAVSRSESGLAVSLENLAGHNVPTGEPSRVLRVHVELLDAGGAFGRHTERLLRSMNTVARIEHFDTSLGIFERRTLRFPFAAPDLARASGARVVVELARTEHEAVSTGADRDGEPSLITLVSTTTVPLISSSR